MAVGEDDAAGLVDDEPRGVAGARHLGVEGARRGGAEDDDGGLSWERREAKSARGDGRERSAAYATRRGRGRMWRSARRSARVFPVAAPP